MQVELTVYPKRYDGLAQARVRQSLCRERHCDYDPDPPVAIVPPLTAHPERRAATVPSQDSTLSQRWDEIFAEALTEVKDQPVYDNTQTTDLYTDGSCSDNGRPFTSAGWGVCVFNSEGDTRIR